MNVAISHRRIQPITFDISSSFFFFSLNNYRLIKNISQKKISSIIASLSNTKRISINEIFSDDLGNYRILLSVIHILTNLQRGNEKKTIANKIRHMNNLYQTSISFFFISNKRILLLGWSKTN